ncbi:hypothetical protein AAAK44_18255 [Clostridioides difficile]
MLRSIEEVSIQLGVSKTSIYNKIKLKKYKDKVVKKQGKSMVDEELFNLIKDSLKVENEVENQKNKKSANEEIAMDREGIFNLNQRLNLELLEQLKEKDKQIAELQRLLGESQKLIENNQILLKQQQDKEINHLMLEDHFKEVDEKLLDLKNKMDKKRKKEKSIFSFFK